MEISTNGKPGAAHWIILAVIIVVAILVRMVAIDTQSLWTDEALTIVLANWPIGDMFLKPTDPTPFLYYALHKLLVPPDASLLVIRSISLVAGILSVGLIYALGRLAFGPAGGLLAAALLAVWRSHVDYSQEARAYSLLFLFTLLTSVGFLYYASTVARPADAAMASRQSRYALAMFGIGNVLAFYTHVVSVFWIALTSLMLMALVVRRGRDRMAEVAILFLLMALCALPGIYRLLEQMRVGDGFDWVQQRGLVGFITMCLEVILPAGLWDNAATNSLKIVGIAKVAILVALLIAIGAGAWLGRRRIVSWMRERQPVFWLTLGYLLVPAIMWLQGFVGRPILIPRVMLYCLPGIILLIIGLCLALNRRAAAWAGVAVVALYCASLLLKGTIREREDWGAAYAYLAGAVSPDDVVAICPHINFPSLRYHATAPVAAAVVTTLGGKLVEIEEKLGGDPDWDRTYFQAFELPLTNARLEGRPLTIGGAATQLALKPDRSIWRIDGHCRETDKDIDRALSAVDVGPGVVRFQRKTSSWAISIRQYRVLAPATLDVQNLAKQH
jgi:hypothetical protein